MKKISLLILINFLFVFVLGNYTNTFAEEKPNIAVIDFKALGVSASEATFVTEFFRNTLVTSKEFKVVDKANMDKILAEQGFQQTGCTTQDCAVQMGKILNVQKMVSGNYGKLGELNQITINLVDVETGEIIYSDVANCKQTEDLYETTNELAIRMIKSLTGKTLAKEQKAQEQPVSRTPNLKEIKDSVYSKKYDEWQYIVKTYNYEEMQITKIYLDKALKQIDTVGWVGLISGICSMPTLMLAIDRKNHEDNPILIVLGVLMCIPGCVVYPLDYVFRGIPLNKKMKEVKRIYQEKGWTLSMNERNDLLLTYNIRF